MSSWRKYTSLIKTRYLVILIKFVVLIILVILKNMEIKNLSENENLEISDVVKEELDARIKSLEESNVQLYSWEEVKNHLKSLR